MTEPTIEQEKGSGIITVTFQMKPGHLLEIAPFTRTLNAMCAIFKDIERNMFNTARAKLKFGIYGMDMDVNEAGDMLYTVRVGPVYPDAVLTVMRTDIPVEDVKTLLRAFLSHPDTAEEEAIRLVEKYPVLG